MNPSEVDSQSTHATGWINSNEPIMDLMGTYHSGGGPHAEDKLKEFIEVNNIRDAILCVYLTKSPCTKEERNGCPKTGKGCTEMLMQLANDRNIKFQMLIRNYYQPSIKESDKSSIYALQYLVESGRFAISVDKTPRSNTGKLINIKFENMRLGNTTSDGFYVTRSPVNNDIQLDIDLGE